MPTLEVNAKSTDGKSVIGISPYVQANGEPAVLVLIKKNANGVYDSTLDGQPALALVVSEDPTGNGPWNLGDLMVQNWEAAKKLARKP
jgi:hypothetical protein